MFLKVGISVLAIGNNFMKVEQKKSIIVNIIL